MAGPPFEPGARRFFFVAAPREVKVDGIAGKTAKPLLLPAKPEAGHRTLTAEGTILLPGSETASRLRFKDLGTIDVHGDHGHWVGDAMDRGMPIVQWLPKSQAKPFTVLKPDFLADEEAPMQGDDEAAEEPAKDAREIEVPPLLRIAGFVEAAALAQVGKVVQFERFGFVRIESPTLGIWLHS